MEKVNGFKKIDDLSYSNLVNLVQGEDIKGADLIANFALELESVKKEIVDAERTLNNLKSRETSLLDAAQKVTKHLKKQLPLMVQRQGYVVILDPMYLVVERNVI